MTCHCWLEDDRMPHVKEVGTSVLQPHGTDSANNLNKPVSGISPEPPSAEPFPSPWDLCHLCLTLVTPDPFESRAAVTGASDVVTGGIVHALA